METSVAKKYYRFGVLEGNHVEERFGLDYFGRPKESQQTMISQSRASHGLQSSLYGAMNQGKDTQKPQNTELLASSTLSQTMLNNMQAYHITPEKESIMKTNVNLNEKTDKDNALKFTHEGEKAHIFFGHGIRDSDFEKRELVSSYNLSYGNKIKPADYIFSKFDSTTVPPVINPEDNVYVKNHLKGITAIGDGHNLTTKKQPRAYNEFTKTFDSVQSKIAFRK